MKNQWLPQRWNISAQRTEIRRVGFELGQILDEMKVPPPVRRKVLTVLQELLFNAQEHGCFGIGREEKERLLGSEGWDAFLADREKTATNSAIEVLADLAGDDLVLTISDPGDGFESVGGVPSTSSLGGRGLALVRSMVRELTTEKKGAQVTARLSILS